MTLSIRPATREDIGLIAELIRALAEYEKLAHEVRFDEAVLGEKLFGARPYAEVVIGEIDGVAQGFALFFHNFSTFEGKPGIYLEDLFVRPEARGSGLGKEMDALLGQIDSLGRELSAGELARLGDLVADAHVGRVLDALAVSRRLAGHDPGAVSSVRKLIGVAHRQSVPEFGLDLLGVDGAEQPPDLR